MDRVRMPDRQARNKDTSGSDRGEEVLVRRAQAFRSLFETVLELEGATPDQVYSILCRNLRQVTDGSFAAFASFDPGNQTLTLRAVDGSDPGVFSLGAELPMAPLTGENQRHFLAHQVQPCSHEGLCFLDMLMPDRPPELRFRRSAGTCYQLSCVRDNELLAVGLVRMPAGQKLKMKDLVDAFLGVAGLILQRINTVALLERNKAVLERAIAAAEDANLAKSKFVANVSHEIRTPLNCIIGFAEIIRQADFLSDAKEQAGAIVQESESLLALVSDILDHAKLEAAKLQLESVPFDLHRLLRDLERSALAQASPKGLALELSIGKEIPERVESDRLRIRQVLMNLIGNAIKFTSEGSIRLSAAPVGSADGRVVVRFEVQDTGIGIPASKQAEIFETFAQVDGSTTRRYGGTGLGLSIARQFVDLLGGAIGCSSEPGQGSVFWVELPLKVAVGEEREVEMARSKLLETRELYQKEGDIRILVVEDYVPNQRVVRLHLENAGYSVEVVDNGVAALEVCGKECFDLILMDVQMPEMDGFEATRGIRAGDCGCRDIPILGLTASADGVTHQLCLEAGMNEVITKPIRRKALLDAVDFYISGHFKKIDLPKVPPSAQSSDVPMEWNLAVREFGGNESVVRQVCGSFLKDLSGDVDELTSSLAGDDFEQLREGAHRIKGGAGSLMAMPLHHAAALLEEAARAGRRGDAEKLLAELRRETERLVAHLADRL